jgi:hypothetical protein
VKTPTLNLFLNDYSRLVGKGIPELVQCYPRKWESELVRRALEMLEMFARQSKRLPLQQFQEMILLENIEDVIGTNPTQNPRLDACYRNYITKLDGYG